MHPGAAGCIGCIIGGPGERRPVGAAAARDASGLRFGHITRPTWQPAALVAPHASRARRQTSPQPPTRPSATWHADAPPCRGRGPLASQPPAGGAPDLALLHDPGDPYGNHQPGSSLQAPAPAEVFSVVGNPLPTSFNRDVPQHVVQKILDHDSPSVLDAMAQVTVPTDAKAQDNLGEQR